MTTVLPGRTGDSHFNPWRGSPRAGGLSIAERGRLRVPPTVAKRLTERRLNAGLSLDQASATSGVPRDVIAELEAGESRRFANARSLLSTIEQVGQCLGLQAGVAASATLTAWATAYSEEQENRVDLRYPPSTAAVTARSLVGDPGLAATGRPSADRDPTLMVGPPTTADDPQMADPRARRREPPRSRSSAVPRTLRRAVWLTVTILIIASAALVVVQVRVVGRTGGESLSSSTSLPTTIESRSRTALVTELTVSTDQASYSVAASTYELSISADRRSWVQVMSGTETPVFAGIVEPGMVRHFVQAHPVTVLVGAGGTRLVVSVGRHTQALVAPVAPFTFALSPVR